MKCEVMARFTLAAGTSLAMHYLSTIDDRPYVSQASMLIIEAIKAIEARQTTYKCEKKTGEIKWPPHIGAALVEGSILLDSLPLI